MRAVLTLYLLDASAGPHQGLGVESFFTITGLMPGALHSENLSFLTAHTISTSRLRACERHSKTRLADALNFAPHLILKLLNAPAKPRPSTSTNL